MHNTATAAPPSGKAPTCIVEPAGLAHPIAMINIKADEAAAHSAAAATTHLWLNPPIAAAPSSVAPAPASGGHTLLHSQLSVIRSLQAQLATLKFQLRQCIDEFAAAAATPQAPTAGGAAPSNNLAAIESRLHALRATYKEIYETLTARSDSLVPRAPLVRDELDVLSNSFFVPVMENAPRGSSKRIVNYDLFRTDAQPTPNHAMHRSALAVQLMQPQQQQEGAVTATGAMMSDDEQRISSARASPIAHSASASDSSATAAAAAAAAWSDLSALLSSSMRNVSFHSALLLNLVQCSGLNPFTVVQKQLRTEFSGSAGDREAKPAAATETKLAAAASSPAVSTAAVSSAALLDSALLFLMEKFYARHLQSCRVIDEARRVHTEEARRTHQATVAAAAALSASSTTVVAPPPPPPPQPLPPAVYPSLPFLRKIVSTASMASPYAPVASAGSGGATSAPAAPLAVEALIVSIPHVLHAYIDFESCDDDADDEETAASEAEFLHSPASLSETSRAARPFRFHRVSIVGWSELSILVDSFAESAFGCFKEVASQARLAAEEFALRAARDIRAENLAAAATAVAATVASTQQPQQHPLAQPDLHRTTTPQPASNAVGASASASASAPASASSASSSSSALPAWYRTAQLRTLIYFVSWLSSYSDLFSRPCAECKLHLALSAPSTLAFAAAAASAPEQEGTEVDVASFPSVPLVAHSMAMMPPCIRLHGLHSSDYTALHAQCIDKYMQSQQMTS